MNRSVSPYQVMPDYGEVRSDLPDGRIARVFFYVSGPEMILLHGFIKKSQKTPEKELKLANKRKKEHERYEAEKN